MDFQRRSINASMENLENKENLLASELLDTYNAQQQNMSDLEAVIDAKRAAMIAMTSGSPPKFMK